MSKYQIEKAKARYEAIKWQYDFCNHHYSWEEMFEFGKYFYKKAKRYGLIKEFKENGILN